MSIPSSADANTIGAASTFPSKSDTGLQSLLRSLNWTAFPALVFLCSRMALLGLGQIGLMIVPTLNWEFGSRDVIRSYPALDALCRWDCWHYGAIASGGYTAPVWTNFFPLYPLLVRAVHQVTGLHINLALLLVSNAAGFGALLTIYRVFLRLAERDAARWALVLFAAFPFAFFQAAGYPESLMIFSSALAILLALRGNHVWAGVVLGFGVLARHLTMFAGAALLVAQIRQRGINPRRLLLDPAIFGLIVPWLFLGGYCLYQYHYWGHPFAFVLARDEPPWSEMSWWGIRELLATELRTDHVQAMYSYIPFALAATIGAFALLSKRAWAELAAFSIIFMLMVWGIGIWGIGRYAASCWPAFLPFGVWLSRRPALQGPTVALLAVFQGLFFYLFSHMFAIL